MSEFKHCPHCNGNGRIVSVSGFKSDRYRVVCDSCGASTRECETEQEAVSAWDMRAGGWIPVGERLPMESGTYVCLTRIKTGLVLVLALDYSAKHKKFNACDSLSEQLADSYSINVTHWQPLPEPPKGAKE